MPKLKKAEYMARNDPGHLERLDVELHVDRKGRFYCDLPEHLRTPFDARLIDSSARRVPEGFFRAVSSSLEALESAIRAALHAYVRPQVTEEPVIRYNIESHVSFAEDRDGNVYPNACWPGAQWADAGFTVNESGRERALDKSRRYGGHHAANPAQGGYGLIIGAKALMKRTIRFGDKERVEYEPYYKGRHRSDYEGNPAALLNSWTSLDLGDHPKEIPYSDEAALFFHSLLLGMAELCRRIQAATFEKDHLLTLIANHSGAAMLLPGPRLEAQSAPCASEQHPSCNAQSPAERMDG